MSYEGYDQYVCVNGHYEARDCHTPMKKCPTCGERFVWENAVDQTNGDGWKEHSEIELALQAAEQRGRDNCLVEVVAWLRATGYKREHDIAHLLESGEWMKT
jgi:hypothetical protein